MIDNSAWKPHVTVAAICQHDNRFLLVREMVGGREVLNQPAGHLDPGESLEQAVVRETLEETAYDFTPTRLCGVYRSITSQGIQETIIRFNFSGEIGQHHDQALDTGIIATQWLTLEELEQSRASHRSEMVLQSVLDYLHKPAYPLDIFVTPFK